MFYFFLKWLFVLIMLIVTITLLSFRNSVHVHVVEVIQKLYQNLFNFIYHILIRFLYSISMVYCLWFNSHLHQKNPQEYFYFYYKTSTEWRSIYLILWKYLWYIFCDIYTINNIVIVKIPIYIVAIDNLSTMMIMIILY